MNLRARSTVDLADLRVTGAALLAAAALLPLLPGPDGVPCPLRTLTGVPCPLCGMTTSVTAAVHLDPLQALAANPAGILAVVVAVGLLLFRRRREVSVPVWALPVALVLMEVWQLARFGML
ncbi:MAG TPA: DUF2752 domain-containing protein [Acidimicrobiales bacterium]|nr:DUF2752 domain-containing protein [Acidimicrobiales bacterium]